MGRGIEGEVSTQVVTPPQDAAQFLFCFALTCGPARAKIGQVAEPARKSHGTEGAGCHCGRQLADAEMVICDKCDCSAHTECVRATVTAGRWRCARCSKPKMSQKKRALDDGARGVSQARNAEEARAAKKKARKEKEKETRVLAKKLADQGLCTVEIPADGHCLFSAVSDQLKRTVSRGSCEGVSCERERVRGKETERQICVRVCSQLPNNEFSKNHLLHKITNYAQTLSRTDRPGVSCGAFVQDTAQSGRWIHEK